MQLALVYVPPLLVLQLPNADKVDHVAYLDDALTNKRQAYSAELKAKVKAMVEE